MTLPPEGEPTGRILSIDGGPVAPLAGIPNPRVDPPEPCAKCDAPPPSSGIGHCHYIEGVGWCCQPCGGEGGDSNDA